MGKDEYLRGLTEDRENFLEERRQLKEQFYEALKKISEENHLIKI